MAASYIYDWKRKQSDKVGQLFYSFSVPMAPDYFGKRKKYAIYRSPLNGESGIFCCFVLLSENIFQPGRQAGRVSTCRLIYIDQAIVLYYKWVFYIHTVHFRERSSKRWRQWPLEGLLPNSTFANRWWPKRSRAIRSYQPCRTRR